MANSFFQFRQFTVRQEHCAMKVGTDGTLLGAWARCPISPLGDKREVLDVGTGTGLIALMMAQRFPEARVMAIDIDAEAVQQAVENVAASPFADRIQVVQADVTTFDTPIRDIRDIRCSDYIQYDSIVCNPPYFVDSLTCPDRRRTLARHDRSLSYRQLMTAASRLLADDGELSVVIPFDCRIRLEQEAALAGLSKVRQCAVHTTPGKPPRRYLLAFRKHPAPLEEETGILEDSPGHRSSWYQQLTKDFYL